MKNRRSLRLKRFDYSQAGAYFMTICTQNRECLFGEIIDLVMKLNSAGKMVSAAWDALQQRFPNMDLDEFIIMPNHIHGIVVLHHTNDHQHNTKTDRRGEPRVRPLCTKHDHKKSTKHKVHPHGTLPGSLGRIVQAFKSLTTHEYINGVNQYEWQSFPGKLWQRNYYEHIIRNDDELYQIRKYIVGNPAQWHLDRENPAVLNIQPGASMNTENNSEIDTILKRGGA